MIAFARSVCGNLSVAKTREWLETNGLGGYASSTIVGLNTRRYHGLLVAATRPPVGRMVLLSKLEDTVVFQGRRYDLSTNQYPGAIYPSRYQLLAAFRLDPFPTFVYDIDGVRVEKRVFLVHGESTVVIEYDFASADETSQPEVTLELKPLIAFRDFHSTTRRNDALDSAFTVDAGEVTLAPYQGVPSLHIALDGAQIEKTGDWYYNLEYEAEFERGFFDREDLFNPLRARYALSPGTSVSIIASLCHHKVSEAPILRQKERQRRASLVNLSRCSDPLVSSLTTAADQFIVRRGELDTIIAGYHWFGDWGRDTMIALPGLTLTTGRDQIARSILKTFAGHVDRGMLPNRFPDGGEEPEYNTVDAALWMFEAVWAFVSQTNDWAFVDADLYDVLADVIDWYQRGTRFGIEVEADGLVHAGEPGAQLTWMDAKVGDFVVTPRHGKPVEVQALWYNALRIMESLARRFGKVKQAARYANFAELAARSFNEAFWYDDGGYLYDVIDGDRRDSSLRPNQILAVSLTHSMLPSDRTRAVVETVERELRTPWGLRTLATRDPGYRGQYVGGAEARDMSYHQGTVWPWLLGPFFMAWLKVHSSNEASWKTIRGWLLQFAEHLDEAGLGQVSEIFDGDAPFQPKGCIAQAWSVAELLRVAGTLEQLDRPAAKAQAKPVASRGRTAKRSARPANL